MSGDHTQRSAGLSEASQPQATQHDSRPRVLLIGTSNAVFSDGYARVLAESGAFRSFENRSIGLASSALFSLQRQAIDFSALDICILDFCCNDASLMEGGFTNNDLITAQMEDAVATISAAGCIPVILIYPIAKALPDGGAVRQIYRVLAETYRLPFLDGYELIERVGFENFSPDAIYADDMHLQRDVAREIGHVLADALAHMADFDRSGGSSLEVDGYAHRLLDAEMVATAGDLLTFRKSRLTSALCADLPSSNRRLAVGPGEEVVAVAANVGYSNCLLAVGGESDNAFRLSTEHFRADGSRFVLGVWPLFPPVAASMATITVAVRPDAMAGVLCGFGPLSDEPPRASLVGFVLRKPARLTISRILSTAVNLAGYIDPNRVRNLRAIHDNRLMSVIVEALYRGLLQREADAGGRSQYVAHLKHRGIAAGLPEICASIANSEEFTAIRRRQLSGGQDSRPLAI